MVGIVGTGAASRSGDGATTTCEQSGHVHLPDTMLSAFDNDDSVLICPILKLLGLREILRKKKVVAVSPIIGSAPVSGHAGKLMQACGYVCRQRAFLSATAIFRMCL